MVQIRIQGVVHESHAADLAGAIQMPLEGADVDGGTHLIDEATFGASAVSNVCVHTARDRALLRAWTISLGLGLESRRYKWISQYFAF